MGRDSVSFELSSHPPNSYCKIKSLQPSIFKQLTIYPKVIGAKSKNTQILGRFNKNERITTDSAFKQR
jgi:hypothetical protein